MPTDSRLKTNASNYKSIRTFIAAPLDATVHEFLLQHQAHISKQPWASNIRWIAQENAHLTLRFLGNTKPRQIEVLRQRLKKVLAPLTAFNITLLQPGPFPTIKRPKVIAAPVKRNQALEQLVATIEKQVNTVGFKPEDRNYRGHITIGRVKRSIPGKELVTETPQSLQTRISSVVLFQSELTPEGSIYTKLDEYPLLLPETVDA